MVRKIAREHNIDLRQVRGTGAGGRITKADVKATWVSSGAAPEHPRLYRRQRARTHCSAAASCRSASACVSAAAPRCRALPAQPPMPRGEQAQTRIEPMSNMRQKIAEHMIFSKAHVRSCHHCSQSGHDEGREDPREAQEAVPGAVRLLADVPAVRRARGGRRTSRVPDRERSIEGTNIVYHNEINLGIAVALDGGSGLIVPVIRNADEKNVVGLQRSIVDLAARARSRQLKPDEVAGGTFSITNFGSFGSVFATPVINQPQVAILGVGAVEKVPVVIDDAIAIRSVAYLALTFDHRLVDGALADQFVAKSRKFSRTGRTRFCKLDLYNTSTCRPQRSRCGLRLTIRCDF